MMRQKQPTEVFLKKDVLRNFTKFTGKQLCQSLFFNKLGDFTSPSFSLEKRASQGDPISSYLFILALEVLFELIKNNADIRGITIFNHTFFHTAFTDDSTFFLNDLL